MEDTSGSRRSKGRRRRGEDGVDGPNLSFNGGDEMEKKVTFSLVGERGHSGAAQIGACLNAIL